MTQSSGTHSPYVKLLLNSWKTQKRIIPQDLKALAKAILEAGSQLQRQTWWTEEATVMEQNRARGINISQDQLLDKGQYSELQRQF